MVHRCCVPDCRQIRIKTLSFHMFPANTDLRKKWIIATKIPHLRKTYRVCSAHFLESDYWMAGNVKRLRKNTVPSVFSWTKKVTGKIPLVDNFRNIPTVKEEPIEEQFEFDNEVRSAHFLESEVPTIGNSQSIPAIKEEPIEVEELVILDNDACLTCTESIKSEEASDENEMAQTLAETLLENTKLKNDLNVLRLEVTQLRSELQKRTSNMCCNPIFCVKKFLNNDSKIHYTTHQTYSSTLSSNFHCHKAT